MVTIAARISHSVFESEARNASAAPWNPRIWFSSVPAVHCTIISDDPEIAAARCSETHDLAVFGEIAWGWKVFDGLVQGLAISVVLPFSASVSLLTYLDLRARDEGMDLVIRARELLTA